MALITVAAPVAKPPSQYTPGILVAWVPSSAHIIPRLLISKSSVDDDIIGSGLAPIAIITDSVGINTV